MLFRFASFALLLFGWHRPRSAGSFALASVMVAILLTWVSPVLAENEAKKPADMPVASDASTPKQRTTAANAIHSSDSPASLNSWTNSPSLLPPPGGLTLTPFLSYFQEASGKISAEQALKLTTASGENFRKRTPSENFTQRESHSVWAYFSMVQVPGFSRTSGNAGGDVTHMAQLAMLDLGDQIPGAASVWIRPTNSTLREVKPDENDLYALTDMAKGGDVLIHMEGQPGLWFAPALRSLPEALGAPERRLHQLALAGLAMLFLLCLTRSVTERGDGRIWAAIFAGAALLHALLDLPATAISAAAATFPHIRYLDMPGILAAGVALMLLPHVGRNIMRTRENSPITDTVLLALAIPGAALGLLPFLSNITWAIRLLPLWPLGAILPLIPALVLLRHGVPGSGIFSLACLSMTVGTGLALWGSAGPQATLWAQGPLIGVIAAVLLLAAAPRSAYGDKIESVSAHKDSDADQADQNDEPLALDMDDVADSGTFVSALRLEESLRAPLDALLREACALDQILGSQTIVMPSPPHAAGGAPKRPFDNMSVPSSRPINEHDARMARRYADNLVAASRELSALVTNIPRAAALGGRPAPTRRIFSLDKLVAEVVASMREEAERKGVGLSWYIAPYLGRTFRADSDRLRFTLRMLLTDAVRATAQGVVSLRVRRGPNSLNPGHLLFSVSDTGEGLPPMARSSLMLARAWELAADHGGELTVNGNPFGVEISFSLDCDALIADGRDYANAPCPPTLPRIPIAPGKPNPNLVILASCVPLNRHLLSWHLSGQGQDVWEARDAAEAVAFYSHTPAALIIVDGNLPEDDIVTAIASVRVFEGEHLLGNAPFLALARDEQQAERLRQAGCDDALLMPVSRDALRAMALQWAVPGSVRPRPDFSPRRVSLDRPKKIVTRTALNAIQDSTTSTALNAIPSTSVPPPQFIIPVPAEPVVVLAVTDVPDAEVKPVAPIAPVPEMPPDIVQKMPPEIEHVTSVAAEALIAESSVESTTESPKSAINPKIPHLFAMTSTLTFAPVKAEIRPDAVVKASVATPEDSANVSADRIAEPAPESAAEISPELTLIRKPSLSLRMVKTPEPQTSIMADGKTLGLPSDNKPGMTLTMSPPQMPQHQVPVRAMPAAAQPAPKVAVGPTISPEAAPSATSTIIVPIIPAHIPPTMFIEPIKPMTSVTVMPVTVSPVVPAASSTVIPIGSPAVQNESFTEAMTASPASLAAPNIATPTKPEPIKNAVPVKKRSWLSLFKPTPYIESAATSSDDAANGASVSAPSRSGSVWVGNPVPVGAPLTPETLAPVTASAPLVTPADQAITSLLSSAQSLDQPLALPSFLPDAPDQHDESTQFFVVNSGKDWQDLGLEPLTDEVLPSFIPSFLPDELTHAPQLAEPAVEPEHDFAITLTANASQDSFHVDKNQFTPLLPLLPEHSAQETQPAASDAPLPAQALLFDAPRRLPESAKTSQPEASRPALLAKALPESEKNRPHRRKGRMQDLPFLSLDPNYMESVHSHDGEEAEGETPLALLSAHNDENNADDILDLTEADMLDLSSELSPEVSPDTSPETFPDTFLVQLLPDMLTHLDAAILHAENAMRVHDARSMAQSAAHMEEQALAFGLHGLSDLALCLKEAAQQHDFEAAAQLLPDLRAEVARQRGE